MIEAIKRFYETHISPENEDETPVAVQHRLQLATAALLIEMAQADDQRHSMEFQAVHDGIMEVFDLSAEETAEIIELADEEAHAATDHFEFTQLINAGFDYPAKTRLVELLWRVCLADAEMNQYEELLVRKIAELLHIEHRDFIAAKLRVQREYSATGHLDEFDDYDELR